MWTQWREAEQEGSEEQPDVRAADAISGCGEILACAATKGLGLCNSRGLLPPNASQASLVRTAAQATVMSEGWLHRLPGHCGRAIPEDMRAGKLALPVTSCSTGDSEP